MIDRQSVLDYNLWFERNFPLAVVEAKPAWKTPGDGLQQDLEYKARVCINGKITRTAVILLGRNESEHYLSPAVARITWVLRNSDGNYKRL
jgi:ATP-dependent DNA helicase RecG